MCMHVVMCVFIVNLKTSFTFEIFSRLLRLFCENSVLYRFGKFLTTESQRE